MLNSGEFTDKCTVKRNSYKIYLSNDEKNEEENAPRSVSTMRNIVAVVLFHATKVKRDVYLKQITRYFY